MNEPEQQSAPDVPQPSLHERWKAIYAAMLAKDRTIRKHQNAVADYDRRMRDMKHLRAMDASALRRQREWLKEEAAAQLRKEAGVLSFPGFVSQRMENKGYQAMLAAKLKRAQDEAQKELEA